MRFPVGRDLDNLDPLWYNAQGFGAVTSYGRHEGDDWNLRSGGNSDLGQPLYAIANGQIVYYHKLSHPTTGFGRHLVVRIEGPWGTRWAHYAHCHDQDFLGATQSVSEGQMVARLGKSGNSPSAHLHFAIFKVDPSTLPNGIDTFAKNETQLNSWWENPTEFIQKWRSVTIEPPMDQDQQRAFDLIKTYRSTRIRNGQPAPEGNWEGYANAIIGSDRELESVQKDLQSAQERIRQLEQQSPPISEPVLEFKTEAGRYLLHQAQVVEEALLNQK